ncbi:MAG: hypothetical protein AABX01_06125 [Candidatus Micrarchaeota archaeon]
MGIKRKAGGSGGGRASKAAKKGRMALNAKGIKNDATANALDGNTVFKYLLATAALFSLVMLLMLFQKQPEKYSALVLLEKTIPKEMEANETFTFGFDILNREGKGGLYSFEIMVDGKSSQAKKAVLANGGRKTFYEALRIRERGKHIVKIILEKENGEKFDVFFKIDIT